MAAPNTPPAPASLPQPEDVPSLSQSIFHLEKKGLDEKAPGLTSIERPAAAH